MKKLKDLLEEEKISQYKLCRELGKPFWANGRPHLNCLKGFGVTFSTTTRILIGLQRMTGKSYKIELKEE